MVSREGSMSWKPIVVGLDGSPEAANAAVFAVAAAQRAATTFHLVHAVPRAGPTLAAAERYATLFGAELRALSVIEPLPVVPEVPQPDATEYYRLLAETVAHDIWSLIRAPGVATLVRHGAVRRTILREAAEW